MTVDPRRIIEHVHGHLGWLAVAALIHPAVVLRDRARRAHLAVGLATGLLTVAAGLGARLYVDYREALRRSVFLSSPTIGLLMERKEHLAFGAVVLGWAGAAAYVGARWSEGELRASLRTVAFRAYVGAAILAAVVAVLGTVVAVHRSF
jgi:hypothetical protein